MKFRAMVMMARNRVRVVGVAAAGVVASAFSAVACSSDAGSGSAISSSGGSSGAAALGTGRVADGEAGASGGGGAGSASPSSSDAGASLSSSGGRGDGSIAAEAAAARPDARSAGSDSSSGATADSASDAGTTTSADGSSSSPDGSMLARVYPAFASASGSIADGIVQLNAYRALVGLGPVTLDTASSSGCAAHLAYLQCAAAASGGRGYLEHTETQYPQCATDGGAQAGVESDLAFGESSSGRQTIGQSFGEAVDGWINGVYHRTPLLDPGLIKVGAASSQGYNCLNYSASGNTVATRAASPVLFPPDGTTDVPETFSGNEGPCPTQPSNPASATSCPSAGFIVSANWYGWTTRNMAAISQVTSVALNDVTAGATVALLTWYADRISGHDPLPGYVRDEIVLVPQSRLPANHAFAVRIDATIQGQAVSTAWQFTTGNRSP